MPTPPTMRKVNPAEAPVLQITVTSPTLPLAVVDEYAETLIVRSISTIDGVANVDIYGQAHPAVRIQVDPNELAARGIGIDQVISAIRNIQRQSCHRARWMAPPVRRSSRRTGS